MDGLDALEDAEELLCDWCCTLIGRDSLEYGDLCVGQLVAVNEVVDDALVGLEGASVWRRVVWLMRSLKKDILLILLTLNTSKPN